jgi:ELWxxDGT repeat protein
MKRLNKPHKSPAVAGVRIACVGAFYLLCSLCVTPTYSQATLLADIGQREFMYNAYSELTPGIDRMFFVGFKSQLWTSRPNADSSEETRLVKRFKSISNLTVAGRTLYFIADDGVSGPELWKSDAATASAAVKVKDIRAGARGSNIQSMTNVYGTLYFSANDGKHGQELWRSNGGPRNTVMVKDITPGSGSSSASSLTDVNGTVFFAAKDGVHGSELWKSSGTAAGTVMVKDIRTEPGLGSSPNQLENVKGTVFFAALKSGVGRELWRSDGTPEGTWLVKDIRPGSIGSGIENTTAVYRTLFFSATDGVHGQELWKSDGTASGTVLVKDMTPGSRGSQGDVPGVSFMGNFANMHGTLFFTALLGQTPHIWKSNGTPAGTVPLHETWGQVPTSPPAPQFVGIEDNVYFIQRDDAQYANFLLGYMNKNGSVEGYVLSLDSNPEEFAQPYHPEMIKGAGHLYISGRAPSEDFAPGFRIVRTYPHYLYARIDIGNVGSNPEAFVRHDDLVYFIADHRYYQQDDLWVTDGTPGGTREVFGFSSEILETEMIGNHLYSSAVYGPDIYKTDLNSGITDYLLTQYEGDWASLLTNVNDSLYFITGSGTLWKSNGTPTSTRVVREFHSIKTMDALKGALLFRVVLADGTEELWRSSASTSATSKLKTLHTGMARNAASYPTATIGDIHYFVANDGIHGNELWKTKGTGASTSMVIDLNTNEPGSDPEDGIRTFVAFRDTLYFSALANEGKWSLYKTNGTASGTEKIINLGPVAHALAEEDQLYLFVHESVTDSTIVLWRTNGTASGTQRIYDFNSASKKIHHTFVNGFLYFSITEGGPLWRTDGTTCGTTQVNTGVRGAYPIEAINSTLIFGAYTDESGQEPYALNTSQIPDAPCDDTIVESGATAARQTGIFSYPNPFTSELAFRVDGKLDELARIKVMTLAGHPVEEIEDLRVNIDHTIGKSWAPGVYLIRVQMKNTVRTHMVVKK